MGTYRLFLGFIIYERDVANYLNLWCYVIFFLLKSYFVSILNKSELSDLFWKKIWCLGSILKKNWSLGSILKKKIGWSILNKSEKSGGFRYLFLRFEISSLLGENFDVPCWELRIDISKSHTQEMIWFVEKIGYFLSRTPIKPISQNLSLSALQELQMKY